MKTSIGYKDALTFGASLLVGCGAAIAIASAAAVSQAAPALKSRLQPDVQSTVQAAPEVVRLDPVVVTVSKAAFDTIRTEEAALARGDARKVTRG